MNFYQHHIGDYASLTGHLSPIEDLAYRRALERYYKTEAALPLDTDHVAKLLRLSEYPEAVEAVLREFFTATPEGWRNPRADEEIERMQEKQEVADERDQHEKTRMQRHREKRAAMFAALAEVGVYPPFNAKTGELEQAMRDADVTLPVTPPHKRSDGTGDGASDARNELATATRAQSPIPEPQPQPIPEPKKKRAQAPFVLPDWVPADAWEGYVEMRRKIRKPMTDRARDLRIADLSKFRQAGHDLAAILDKSTANNWTDLYEPKPNGRAPGFAPAGSEPPWRTEQRERMAQAAPYAAARPSARPVQPTLIDEANDAISLTRPAS